MKKYALKHFTRWKSYFFEWQNDILISPLQHLCKLYDIERTTAKLLIKLWILFFLLHFSQTPVLVHVLLLATKVQHLKEYNYHQKERKKSKKAF